MLPFDIFPFIIYRMKIYMSNIEHIKNIPDLEKKLSESELLQYNRFTSKNRKLQYLLSHTIVRDVCGENIVVKNGAPTIKSGFVSITHKDNLVAVAVSKKQVGIDIENTDVVRNFVEQSELLGLPKTKYKKTFYKNFVDFEARFKFGDGADKASTYFYEMDNYLIGICTKEKSQNIHFIFVGLNKNRDIK